MMHGLRRWLATALAALSALAAAAATPPAGAAETAPGATATAAGGRTPLPVIARAASGTACVADAATMRREHPALLKHQRDITVRRGVRDGRDSLQGCIGCHASATTGSVAQAKTDFCSSCHAYAAVQIDCFECHSSRPRPTATAAATAAPGAGGRP